MSSDQAILSLAFSGSLCSCTSRGEGSMITCGRERMEGKRVVLLNSASDGSVTGVLVPAGGVDTCAGDRV